MSRSAPFVGALGAFLFVAPLIAVAGRPGETQELKVALVYRFDEETELGPKHSGGELLAVSSGRLEPVIYEIPALVPGSSVVELTIEVPIDAEFELQAHSQMYFSQPVKLNTTGDKKVVIEMLPAGQVEGRLLPKPGWVGETLDLALFEPPKSLTASGVDERRSFRISCAVQDQKSFRCQVPAGSFEARISASSWCPISLWGLRIEAGKVKDIGDLEFEQCSMLTGTVQVEAGAGLSIEDVGPIQVDLEPQMVADPSELTLFRVQHGDDMDLLSYRTETDSAGGFEIHGVRPGTYRLHAVAENWSPASMSSVVVNGQANLDLTQPLVLTPPVKLSVFIDPPKSPRDSSWSVHLIDPEHRSETKPSPADESGHWTKESLLPGHYFIRLEESIDTHRLPEGWYFEEIYLESGEQILEIEVPVIEVRGRVLKADRPIAATLHFGGQHSPLSVTLSSDDDGIIEGMLPRAGIWPIDAEYEGSGGVQALADIELHESEDGEPVSFDIEIPETLLTGIVLDESGQGVSGAEVEVVSLERRRRVATTTSDGTGRFEIAGLLEEQVEIRAHNSIGAGEWRTVEVLASAPEYLELSIREKKIGDWKLVAGDTGVAGAWIQYRPSDQGLASLRSVVTAGDGSFKINAESDTVLSLVVLAPNHGLAMRRVSFGGSTTKTGNVELHQQSGTLVIEPAERDYSDLVLEKDLVAIDLSTLQRRLGLKPKDAGSGFRIQAEPGTYSLCSRTLAAGGGGLEAACARARLVAAGEARLQLPATEGR